jgi:short-subunit dehydrogenase
MAGQVLIYGGSGGIGSAVIRILHSRGYDLHLVGRNEERLSAIATECGANFTLGNVNDGSLFSRAVKDSGESLDGLVYGVGAALAIQAALPALKKSTGTASVVLFSSVAARSCMILSPRR